MNKINITPHILIICPTYKESFILRRALIDLNVNWWNPYRNNINIVSDWKKVWDEYQENTIYEIIDNKITYGNIRSYKNPTLITVSDFIKKYIRTYE